MQQIESVRVGPGFAIARIGNKDGPIAPVPAQFDAVAYANGGWQARHRRRRAHRCGAGQVGGG
ncbi:MAG: hypothetical protein U1F68_18510 [Gammaproteobacteria bacterium]